MNRAERHAGACLDSLLAHIPAHAQFPLLLSALPPDSFGPWQDLRGTKACEWPADLARPARRPGLELRLDAPPHDREDDNIYAAEYSFHVDDGLPWEVERREQRAAMEASWRQAEGQQAAQPNVAQPIAALAALEVQLQALHAMHLAAQDLAQAAGQPWQPPAVDALQRAQQWAHF